jgi:hypothetical protein
MAVDTPAKIAIVGAGPIGLEAALYARYLGYEVDLYERGVACEHLRRWSHVTPFTPWAMNTTPLAIAALTAQDERWTPAAPEAYLTYGELVDRYFQPLADCDLLADCVQPGTEVVRIGREGLLRADWFDDERRIDVPFRILVRDAEGRERIEFAEVVLDSSGVMGTPNPLGCGGVPAVGEARAAARVWYGVPDVEGADRARFAGRRTLVVGSGHAAATVVTTLARLNAHDPATQVAWSTRRVTTGEALGPVAELPDDPLSQRASLAKRANLLVAQEGGPVAHRPMTHVESIEYDEGAKTFAVELGGQDGGHETFDEVVACTGYRPDERMLTEMQLGPADRHGARLDAPHPEPDFYILGAKSFGRRDDFTIAVGHEQIRALFAVIGDRETLNLYATHPRVV